MVSFDVVSLFTKVPISLALSTVEDLLNKDSNLDSRTSLNVTDIMGLLKLCLESNDFVFKNNYYHQKFGCAMGNPVSTVIANLVMEHVENRIFSSSNNTCIRFWKRFVDDVWVWMTICLCR